MTSGKFNSLTREINKLYVPFPHVMPSEHAFLFDSHLVLYTADGGYSKIDSVIYDLVLAKYEERAFAGFTKLYESH